MKNLSTLSSSELLAFLDSFDDVLCDCDGVIWEDGQPIQGLQESLSAIKRLGKKLRFVTNNSTQGANGLLDILNKSVTIVQIDDIAIPSMAVIDYLKRINYKKKLYVVGTSFLKMEFTEAGFDVADSDPSVQIGEHLGSFKNTIVDDENVGAVFYDFDYNFNYTKLNKCLIYLLRNDVHFFIGSSGRRIATGLDTLLIGSGYFQDILTDATGRKPSPFGKPGVHFHNYIREKFQIKEPSRALFIGDSVSDDMVFASKCGYQKLLTLTGTTTIEEMNALTDPDTIPDFYIDSLGSLDDLLKKKLSN